MPMPVVPRARRRPVAWGERVPDRATEATGVLATAPADASGMRWAVTIIREGVSINGWRWRRHVLEAEAARFEGAPVGLFVYGDTCDLGLSGCVPNAGHLPDEVLDESPGAGVGNFVGRYEGVRVEDGPGGRAVMRATLVLFDTARAFGARLMECAQAGWFDGDPPRIGLSVDTRTLYSDGVVDGQQVRVVEKITEVRSCDVVVNPSAGGRFDRLVEQHVIHTGGCRCGDQMNKIMIAVLAALEAVKGQDSAKRIVESAGGDKLNASAAVAILRANLPKDRATEDVTEMLDAIEKAVAAGETDTAVTLLKAFRMAYAPKGDGGTDKPAEKPAEEKAAEHAQEQADASRRATEAATREALVAKLVEDKLAERDRRTMEAANIEALIVASGLAPEVQDHVRADCRDYRITEAVKVEAIIKRRKAEQSRADESVFGAILGHAGTRHEAGADGATESGLTEAERLQIATDKLFGLDASRAPEMVRGPFGRDVAPNIRGLYVGGKTLEAAREAYSQVPRFNSPRECFQAWTGMRFGDHVVGHDYVRRTMEAQANRYRAFQTGLARSFHPATSGRAKEIVTVSGNILANALGASTQRAVTAEYRLRPNFAGEICRFGTTDNFKARQYLRYGHIQSVATVAESGTYTDLLTTTRTQEAISITPAKRGGLVYITEEAFANDDLGFFERLGSQLGGSALRFLNQFAFDLLLGYTSAINDTNYADGVALYNAAHSNIIATAFSAANVHVMRRQMLLQADPDSLDQIGVEMRVLVVPEELFPDAETLRTTPLGGQQLPNTANVDANVLQGTFKIVRGADGFLRSDTNNYYGLASPAEFESLRIDFYDGEEEPQILVQDQPTVATVFTNDRIAYRIRQTYGGAVTDFRGLQAGIVA